MGTLANSEDPDEMPHNVAFHQGLHCLLRQNLSSVQEIQYSFLILICECLIHTMDFVYSFMENSNGLKRVKWCS